MPYFETIERTVGDDWQIDLTINNADGTPFTGLSNDAIVCTIRHRDTDAIMWSGSEAAGDISVTSDAAGEITIIVPRVSTATFEQRLYQGDVEITTDGNARVTPKRFFLQAVRDSTRA